MKAAPCFSKNLLEKRNLFFPYFCWIGVFAKFSEIPISEFQIFKSQSLLSEVSQRKLCQCNVVYMLKQTLNYKSFKLLRVMKVTWEFISKVIRVMTSIPRADYPFNCPWGHKEKHKSNFLQVLMLNEIETNFDYEYIRDLLKGIVVRSDKQASWQLQVWKFLHLHGIVHFISSR